MPRTSQDGIYPPSDRVHDWQNLAEYKKHKPRTQPNRRSANPLLAGINDYLRDFRTRFSGADDFLPRKYTLYQPLLLLPVNFTNVNPIWEAEYQCLRIAQKQELFQSIADAFTAAGQRVTHVAINAPISNVNSDDVGLPNVMRSPTGLFPVLGDWGPSVSSHLVPTAHDFETAFWVSTAQDHGITQTWAPRWTMFSHGNLSEKKRILGDPSPQQRDIFTDQSPEEIASMQVLDMYVGIGYFALCYLARGVSRVWGWDLNAWSIEGLRRGCESNGWICKVLKVAEDGTVMPSLETLVSQLRQEEHLAQDLRTRCIAFRGNNQHAVEVTRAIEVEWKRQDSHGPNLNLRFDHINLGLLPDSLQSWPGALQLVGDHGRLHIHQNAQTREMDQTSSRIKDILDSLSQEHRSGLTAQVTHVEMVKTYGPGLTHCVFDVQMRASQD